MKPLVYICRRCYVKFNMVISWQCPARQCPRSTSYTTWQLAPRRRAPSYVGGSTCSHHPTRVTAPARRSAPPRSNKGSKRSCLHDHLAQPPHSRRTRAHRQYTREPRLRVGRRDSSPLLRYVGQDCSRDAGVGEARARRSRRCGVPRFAGSPSREPISASSSARGVWRLGASGARLLVVTPSRPNNVFCPPGLGFQAFVIWTANLQAFTAVDVQCC